MRSVQCVARGKPFKAFLALGTDKANPRVSATSSIVRANKNGIPFIMVLYPLRGTRPRGNINIRSVLPSHEHSYEQGQDAESTTALKKCLPAAPPAGSTVRVWHIHLRRTAVDS